MNTFLYIILFFMGISFGSFFTLAVYRIPLRQNITHERSYCPNCKHKLGFLDLIPMFSYIFIKGKCRYCKEGIPSRYFILEILSGISFVLLGFSLNLNAYTITIPLLIYFIFTILYITFLFIIAGIDKTKNYIEKPVLLFGFICVSTYIAYVCIVDKATNMYTYAIYYSIILLLSIFSTKYLRKNSKSSYTIDILILLCIINMFVYEAVTILTITLTLLIITFNYIRIYLINKKNIGKKINIRNNMPVALYIAISNILVMCIANYTSIYL